MTIFRTFFTVVVCAAASTVPAEFLLAGGPSDRLSIRLFTKENKFGGYLIVIAESEVSRFRRQMDRHNHTRHSSR